MNNWESINLTSRKRKAIISLLISIVEDNTILMESNYVDADAKKQYFLEALASYKMLRFLGERGLRSEEDFIAKLRQVSGLNVSDVE